MRWRTILVDGVEWRYHVGTLNVEARRISDGHKIVSSVHQIKDVSPDVVEKGRWKKTSDGMLRPAEITRWLRNA